jgi:pSer/pThr/pTyr-binding forkhead associated (FHA) protein
MNINDEISRLQITFPNGRTREFSIPLAITTISRQAGSDLVLNPPQALRRHAPLTRTDGEVEIGDQGSSNGTHIDGEKSTTEVPKILAEWNEIKMGDFRTVLHRIPVAQPGRRLAKATR